ncbi:hypothetical protein [Parabacteroides pacaensis]|uniref:hypothetical protein n=1 Tax=Parabacteroides pacaensis TaxID=2086575 RepID=UPI000D0F08EA|nr:hypothetical protein [Parabacteroides pacaensis]
MALKLEDAIFNKASNQAIREALTKTAEERLKVMGASAFPAIITELKKSTVDKTFTAELERKINAATNKNQEVIDVIKKGGAIADTLIKILR